jgi:hypothetical protein
MYTQTQLQTHQNGAESSQATTMSCALDANISVTPNLMSCIMSKRITSQRFAVDPASIDKPAQAKMAPYCVIEKS